MSPGDIVALIVILFFVIGVIVGVITVIALSAIRRDRVLTGRNRAGIDSSILQEADEADEAADDYRTGASGVAGHWGGIAPDGTASNDRPRWPGDIDGGQP